MPGRAPHRRSPRAPWPTSSPKKKHCRKTALAGRGGGCATRAERREALPGSRQRGLKAAGAGVILRNDEPMCAGWEFSGDKAGSRELLLLSGAGPAWDRRDRRAAMPEPLHIYRIAGESCLRLLAFRAPA